MLSSPSRAEGILKRNSVRPIITVLNGSLGGSHGNTSRLIAPLITHLSIQADVSQIILSDPYDPARLAEALKESHAFVFATGTYWDSWGSPLQRFLEIFTQYEGTSLWLGKPASVVVTMHSVGGKEVLSRFQGVLSTLGLLIPPMSGLAYSLADQLALRHEDNPFHGDFWSLDDLEVVASNLIAAIPLNAVWTPWTVDKQDPSRIWIDPATRHKVPPHPLPR